MSHRPLRDEDVWDQFIDALDRAGQSGGGTEGVRVPACGTGVLAGRAFGDLTRADVQQLERVARTLARRSDTLLGLWEDMRRRLKPPRSHRPRRVAKS